MEIRIPRPQLPQFPQGVLSKKALISIIVAIVIILGVVLWFNWPFKHYPGLAMSPKWNIAENIMSEPSDSYFATYIHNMGYDTFLHNQGPFTVFVPLNAYYANLPADQRDVINDKDNQGALRQILLFHVVKGEYRFADLKDGMKLKTLEGEELIIRKYGQYLSLNNGRSYIKTYDIISSNGVIHLITNFLIPESML